MTKKVKPIRKLKIKYPEGTQLTSKKDKLSNERFKKLTMVAISKMSNSDLTACLLYFDEMHKFTKEEIKQRANLESELL